MLAPGDLLLEKSGGGENQPVGKTVLWDHESAAVCSNFVARVRAAPGVHPAFLCYLLEALYILRVNLRSIKQNTGIQNLDSFSYFRELVAVPNERIQRVIAQLLDEETTKIDALIKKKNEILLLHEEERSETLGYAIRGHFDPLPPMWDSGITMLGVIPRYWPLIRLKYLARIQAGLTLGKSFDSEELKQFPYLRVANVQAGRIDLREVATVYVPPSVAMKHQLQMSDVLMTEGGDHDKLGRGLVWIDQIDQCLHQNHVFAIRCDESRLLPRYLALLTLSPYVKAYFAATSKQTTNLASTNQRTIGELPIPLPPIDQQRLVLARVDRHEEFRDRVVTSVQASIERLREYRSALITAAVTSQIYATTVI